MIYTSTYSRFNIQAWICDHNPHVITNLVLRYRFRQETDSYSDDTREAKQKRREVQVVKLGDHVWSGVLFATERGRPRKLQDESNNTSHETNHQTPERPLPQRKKQRSRDFNFY